MTEIEVARMADKTSNDHKFARWMEAERADSFDEELEMELDDERLDNLLSDKADPMRAGGIDRLPAGAEIVLFDRSWYNRAGVERVMGFCNEIDVEEFFRSVPEFERMLVRSG